MAAVIGNNAVSRLASSLTSGATTLSVTTGEGAKFPSPSAGQWLPLTLIKASGSLEIVRCTARTGDMFTVVRSQEGTSSQAFAAGDRVELRLTAGVFNDLSAELHADVQAAQDAADAASDAAADATTSAQAANDKVDLFPTLYTGFRNLLINALGTVNQRGYASGTVTSIANQYTLDRWRVVTSGQSLIYAASANGYLMTAPAGGVEQVIEGRNVEGGVYTLSWTGTATATVNGAAITNGGQTASLAANTNVTIRFSSGTFEKPQFEAGSQKTKFEQRGAAIELLSCQRYYCLFNAASGGSYPTASGAQAVAGFYFPVPMRVVPTLIQGTQTGFNVATITLSTTNMTNTGGFIISVQAGSTGNFYGQSYNNQAIAEL